MMMSKPAPEEEAPPSFAQQPPTMQKTSAVEDLERRLAMLGDYDNDAKPAAVAPTMAPPPPTTTTAAAVKGGKNALLARIMAAKEKSQAQAQAAMAPPKQEAPDLLSAFDSPADPPPMYSSNVAPPVSAPPASSAPPAFDAVQNTIMQQAFPPPPPIDAVMTPPASIASTPNPGMMSFAPPAASAPSFESLMETTAPQQTHQSNHLAGMQALPPPQTETAPALPPAIDEDILAALDPAEREALLEEQRQIMEQIEQKKSNNEASDTAARAMAFNQRSSAAVANLAASMDGPSRTRAPTPRAPTTTTGAASSNGNTVNLGHGEAVPLHGQEKTEQAIKDGTAVIVQCMSCSNWMQVTEAASLMFCPICQVVCPVEKAGAATSADMEAAAQLAADAQLAEELQKEEYKKAGGAGSARPRQRQQPKPTTGDQSTWLDWLVGSPAPAQTASPSNRSSSELNGRGSSSGTPRLVAAQTGDETQGLIRPSSGARVAEQKTLFACVADSVSAAAEQMTAITLPTDQEGNVHGVDSSSLLAMPDVSRQTRS